MSLYSIDDLTDMLGAKYDPLYNRVKRLDQQFEDVTARGKQNKIMVTDNGLALLRRLLDLEDDGATIESGIKDIEQEMETEDDTEDIQTDLRAELNRKEDRIKELEEQVRWLRARVEKAEQEKQRLLPSARESMVDKIRRLFVGDSE